MPAFNAIGMDAVGTSGSTTNSQTSFSCSLSSSSTLVSSLTTGIALAAALMSSASSTSSLNSSAAQLSAILSSQSTVAGALTTKINLQANLLSTSSVAAPSLSSAVAFNAVLATRNVLTGTLTSAQVIPMFTPSLARTINIQATSPLFTGGKWWTLTDPKKPRGAKDPDAVIDITFDWSVWLDDIGSVQISDVTFSLNGVTSVGSFSDGTKVTVFVAGGTPGSAATVACKITTLTTPIRTDERTIYLDIADE